MKEEHILVCYDNVVIFEQSHGVFDEYGCCFLDGDIIALSMSKAKDAGQRKGYCSLAYNKSVL